MQTAQQHLHIVLTGNDDRYQRFFRYFFAMELSPPVRVADSFPFHMPSRQFFYPLRVAIGIKYSGNAADILALS